MWCFLLYDLSRKYILFVVKRFTTGDSYRGNIWYRIYQGTFNDTYQELHTIPANLSSSPCLVEFALHNPYFSLFVFFWFGVLLIYSLVSWRFLWVRSCIKYIKLPLTSNTTRSFNQNSGHYYRYKLCSSFRQLACIRMMQISRMCFERKATGGQPSPSIPCSNI